MCNDTFVSFSKMLIALPRSFHLHIKYQVISLKLVNVLFLQYKYKTLISDDDQDAILTHALHRNIYLRWTTYGLLLEIDKWIDRYFQTATIYEVLRIKDNKCE